MPPFLAVGVLTFAVILGSCRLIEKQSKKVEFKPASEIWQIVDSLILSGNDLRRLDVLALEGTAGLSSSECKRTRSKILEVASGHARKYRGHMLQLAKLPKNRADDEIHARSAANGKVANLVEIIKVIDLHLRLARAETPPSESRIIWDYGNLRYLGSFAE
jgi:hypothetical protein